MKKKNIQKFQKKIPFTYKKNIVKKIFPPLVFEKKNNRSFSRFSSSSLQMLLLLLLSPI